MSANKIKKVLIANRGEIAIRVMRTCKELGIKTVAVYSEPDKTALHVRLADEAYFIGPAASSESYLVQEKILDVAKKSGADAIHPGYGFLSENADFSEACTELGINFIGPPPAAIRSMGDKTSARLLMEQAGVPMAPGTTDSIEDVAEAARIASEEIGYPVLIKAAAGGGGKGMRIVEKAEDFERAMISAQSEARNAFGDDRVYVEKYVSSPRHIEIQILADKHGNVVHLFERECSIQRRHQKVIEEAPSAVLTPELRQEMGEAAIACTKSCDYVGVGTVEFLLDHDMSFYFMEMNTRLQVEHPVTEGITGLDLVAEQIRMAEGEKIGYSQDDLSINGHAIECRIYAEDPKNNFLPDPGTLVRHAPPSGFGVRVDSGIEQGLAVEIHYDPMISKLTTWGKTRDEAIRRMRRALAEYDIAGLETTIPFCQFVMDHEAFTSGNINTHFVGDHYDADKQTSSDEMNQAVAIAAVLYKATQKSKTAVVTNQSETQSTSQWTARRWKR